MNQNQQDHLSLKLLLAVRDSPDLETLSKNGIYFIQSLRPEIKKKVHHKKIIETLEYYYVNPQQNDYRNKEIKIHKILASVASHLNVPFDIKELFETET